jgi:hypothetical protein
MRVLLFFVRYGCNPAHLESFADYWKPLWLCESTRAFIDECVQTPISPFATGTQRVLTRIFPFFEVNGLLGLYPMHLLSTTHWHYLLSPHDRNLIVLDVGAGAGDVTSNIAPLTSYIHCTETSKLMAWRLRRKGYAVSVNPLVSSSVPLPPAEMLARRLPAGLTHSRDPEGTRPPYDAVLLLNLLDRCERAQSLLDQVAIIDIIILPLLLLLVLRSLQRPAR